MNTSNMYYFFTDGATSKNGSSDAVGGWAWLRAEFAEDGTITVCESDAQLERNTTNNRCELLAIINACKYARNHLLEPTTIYSDSAYVINCYKNKWYENWIYNGWKNYKREPVANKDLWEQLIPFFKDKDYSFEKVKGHANNKCNNIVDRMAVEARSQDNG